MDPNATLARLIDAALARDSAELVAAASDLASWLEHGGFPPDDPRAPKSVLS